MCVCFTPSPMEVAENTSRICVLFTLQNVSTGLIRSVDHISWILVGAMDVIISNAQLDPLTVAAHTSAHCPALVTRMTGPGHFFQKSEIFKISSSSHPKNAHIKLIGFQWVFGGWGDAPFIFFMGRMGQKSKNGPSRAPHPPVRAVYPPGVGLLVDEIFQGRAFKKLSHFIFRASG